MDWRSNASKADRDFLIVDCPTSQADKLQVRRELVNRSHSPGRKNFEFTRYKLQRLQGFWKPSHKSLSKRTCMNGHPASNPQIYCNDTSPRQL
jgi:hypothetical protein